MKMLTTIAVIFFSILMIAQAEVRQEKIVVVDVCDTTSAPVVTIKCSGNDCDDPRSIERIELMNTHLPAWLSYHSMTVADLDDRLIEEWREEFNAYERVIERDKQGDRNLLSFFNN